MIYCYYPYNFSRLPGVSRRVIYLGNFSRRSPYALYFAKAGWLPTFGAGALMLLNSIAPNSADAGGFKSKAWDTLKSGVSQKVTALKKDASDTLDKTKKYVSDKYTELDDAAAAKIANALHMPVSQGSLDTIPTPYKFPSSAKSGASASTASASTASAPQAAPSAQAQSGKSVKKRSKVKRVSGSGSAQVSSNQQASNGGAKAGKRAKMPSGK